MEPSVHPDGQCVGWIREAAGAPLSWLRKLLDPRSLPAGHLLPLVGTFHLVVILCDRIQQQRSLFCFQVAVVQVLCDLAGAAWLRILGREIHFSGAPSGKVVVELEGVRLFQLEFVLLVSLRLHLEVLQ